MERGGAGLMAGMGKRIDTYKSLVGRKRPLGRPRHWLERLYRNASHIGWEGVDWIDPAQEGSSG